MKTCKLLASKEHSLRNQAVLLRKTCEARLGCCERLLATFRLDRFAKGVYLSEPRLSILENGDRNGI